MKVLERVIEERVRKIVKMDNMLFGFMAGRSTTDAIFIVRQLQEKYLAKKKDLWNLDGHCLFWSEGNFNKA